jgi:hypothetical protein
MPPPGRRTAGSGFPGLAPQPDPHARLHPRPASGACPAPAAAAAGRGGDRRRRVSGRAVRGAAFRLMLLSWRRCQPRLPGPPRFSAQHRYQSPPPDRQLPQAYCLVFPPVYMVDVLSAWPRALVLRIPAMSKMLPITRTDAMSSRLARHIRSVRGRELRTMKHWQI